METTMLEHYRAEAAEIYAEVELGPEADETRDAWLKLLRDALAALGFSELTEEQLNLMAVTLHLVSQLESSGTMNYAQAIGALTDLITTVEPA